MTGRVARNVIVIEFVLALALAIVVAFVAYAKETISASDLRGLVLQLFSTFSVHLAVILGGIFASTSRSRQAQVGSAGWVAIVTALLWNGILLGRQGLFLAAVFDPGRADSMEELVTFLQTFAEPSSFLVTGALAFFFTKTA